LLAAERDETKRAAFWEQVAAVASERLVVVDETSINIAMARRYARAPRGQRAYGRVPRNHGSNLSVIGAVGLRGVVASLSVAGAVDTIAFDVFVHRVLLPALQPGDVVLLDNLKVHPASQIETAVRQAQGAVLFLPPYSPDFSPIEQCWSKLKTFLRGAKARTTRRLQRALRAGLQTITPQDLQGWFRHCGYEVTTN